MGKKLIALVLGIGALAFLSDARAENQWLDDPHQHVGLTYGAYATVQTADLWRGLHVGALNTQLDANVGYGGLYFDMWWNLGTADWTFRTFQPEVDFTLGFNRWGVDVYLLFIHNFNSPFFDFGIHPGGGGNGLELGARYTVSSKLPLSLLWATRISANDGYMNAAGDIIRAYSTYIELSYTWNLRDGFSIYSAFGVTPWKSMYTGYNGHFAVQNVEVRLRKDWDIAPRCGLMLQGQLAVNPCGTSDVIHTNLTLGVYLK